MSFIRKVTHQILDRSTPYENVLHQHPSLEEQKLDVSTPSFIGSMTIQESKASAAPIQLGSYEDIDHLRMKYAMNMLSGNSKLAKLPLQEYDIYAPVIGKMKYILGNPEVKIPHPTPGKSVMNQEQVASHLLTKLDSQSNIDWNEIEIAIKNDIDVKQNLILTLADSISRNPLKAIIFSKAKPILSKLVKLGANYEWAFAGDENRELFMNLVNHGLNGDALTLVLARVHLSGSPHSLDTPLIDPSFGHFAEMALLCVPKGADINAVQYSNASFGSYLHLYLGYEYPEPVKLIRFLDSMNHFNFEARDGYGQTPLLLAIKTCREDAGLALLELAEKKKIKVGIDILDSNGRTPLLLAAALGLEELVKKLLKLGANPLAKDTHGHGLDYYANLSEQETAAILSPVIHPYRCNSTFVTPDGKREARHSYLYWKDRNSSPVCLYKQGEMEKTGDDQIPHLVVLSTHKDYIGRVHEAIACVRKLGNKEHIAYFEQQLSDIEGTKPVVTICLEDQKKVRKLLKQKSVVQSIAEYKRDEEEANVSIPCSGKQANAYFERLASTLDSNPQRKGLPLIRKNADGMVLLPKFWLEQLNRSNPDAIDELSREFNCPKTMLSVTTRR